MTHQLTTQEKRKFVIEQFLPELSAKFNRTEKTLTVEGLTAYDFKGQVRLVYEDGSYLHYQNAFLVKNTKLVGVFTEHCGYFIFDITDFDDYVEDAPYAPVFPR